MPSDQPDHSQNQDSAPGEGVDFELSAETAARGLNRSILKRWEAVYETGPRQLRRWWKEGAPLDNPAAMPAWWERTHAWSIPERIQAAAVKATASQLIAPSAGPVPIVVESPQTSAPAPPPPSENPPPPVASKVTPINIEDFDPDEGDRLRELKQIQAAKFDELSKALKAGSESAGMLETKYLKLCETVDKMESRVTERVKKKGLFVMKAAVARDLATAAELIRQMGESEARRVLELCPALDGAQREAVIAAVRQLAESRSRVFRNLASLKSVADVDQLIAA